MTNESKTNEHNQQSANTETEADVAKRKAGVTDKSSHDHMSREKAGEHEGAGGGAKQKQNHR